MMMMMLLVLVVLVVIDVFKVCVLIDMQSF